jgi:hypothetical protein
LVSLSCLFYGVYRLVSPFKSEGALENRAIPFNLTNGGNWFLLDVRNKAIAVLPPNIVGLNNHDSAVIYIPRISIRSIRSPKGSS